MKLIVFIAFLVAVASANDQPNEAPSGTDSFVDFIVKRFQNGKFELDNSETSKKDFSNFLKSHLALSPSADNETKVTITGNSKTTSTGQVNSKNLSLSIQANQDLDKSIEVRLIKKDREEKIVVKANLTSAIDAQAQNKSNHVDNLIQIKGELSVRGLSREDFNQEELNRLESDESYTGVDVSGGVTYLKLSGNAQISRTIRTTNVTISTERNIEVEATILGFKKGSTAALVGTKLSSDLKVNTNGHRIVANTRGVLVTAVKTVEN